MSAFIPPTPDDGYLAADAQRLLRIHDFCAGAQVMPGQMGELFRAFVHAYNEFLPSNQSGNTTEQEDVRMGNLLFAHMECWEWLRAGEQS